MIIVLNNLFPCILLGHDISLTSSLHFCKLIWCIYWGIANHNTLSMAHNSYAWNHLTLCIIIYPCQNFTTPIFNNALIISPIHYHRKLGSRLCCYSFRESACVLQYNMQDHGSPEHDFHSILPLQLEISGSQNGNDCNGKLQWMTLAGFHTTHSICILCLAAMRSVTICACDKKPRLQEL